MPPAQRTIFIIGLLGTIALAATVLGILLHRAFPHSHWVTLLAPVGAATAVIALASVFFRK